MKCDCVRATFNQIPSTDEILHDLDLSHNGARMSHNEQSH